MCFIRTTVIKCILYSFNVLFALCGVATIVVGSLVLAGHIGVHNKVLHSKGFAITFIVVGGILLVEAYLGLSGVVNDSIAFLRLQFCVAMVVVCSLQLVANILLAKGMRDSNLKGRLQTAMDSYNNSGEDQNYWDETQGKFKCCGIDGSDDWKANGFSLPRSCCKKLSSRFTKESEKCKVFGEEFKYIYKKGCQERLVAAKKKFLLAIRVESSVLSVVEISSVIFAFWLALRIKENLNGEDFSAKSSVH